MVWHVAKFRGDRPRELGDYALNSKKKENITSKIEDLPFYRTGGLKTSKIGPERVCATAVM